MDKWIHGWFFYRRCCRYNSFRFSPTRNPLKTNNMTPKEKAEELFMKFNKEGLQQLVPLMDRFGRKEIIKQCAFIAAVEAEKAEYNVLSKFDIVNIVYKSEYWKEVKEEIKKL